MVGSVVSTDGSAKLVLSRRTSARASSRLTDRASCAPRIISDRAPARSVTGSIVVTRSSQRSPSTIISSISAPMKRLSLNVASRSKRSLVIDSVPPKVQRWRMASRRNRLSFSTTSTNATLLKLATLPNCVPVTSS